MSRKGAGNNESISTLCPLFKASNANWIRCESHVPDSETVEIRYAHASRCRAQRTIFCEGCYQRCEHYRSYIHMKWPEDEK